MTCPTRAPSFHLSRGVRGYDLHSVYHILLCPYLLFAVGGQPGLDDDSGDEEEGEQPSEVSRIKFVSS